MIPTRVPPPPDAVGWTPNALGPPVAAQVPSFVVTTTNIPAFAASSFGSGARLVVLKRRLDFVELDAITGTTWNLATVSGGAMIAPIWGIVSASNVSGSGYNTSQSLSVRNISGAVDLFLIGGIANTVGPTNRVLIAPPLTVTLGTFAVATSGLMLRQNARPIYLGVPGTDIGNYVEISVTCFLTVP